MALEKVRSACVVFQLVGVLATIDLHDEAGVTAKEVQDIGIERDLPFPPPAA